MVAPGSNIRVDLISLIHSASSTRLFIDMHLFIKLNPFTRLLKVELGARIRARAHLRGLILMSSLVRESPTLPIQLTYTYIRI